MVRLELNHYCAKRHTCRKTAFKEVEAMTVCGDAGER